MWKLNVINTNKSLLAQCLTHDGKHSIDISYHYFKGQFLVLKSVSLYITNYEILRAESD